MALFEAFVSCKNDVLGTQKLVCSHVLSQTQWWSLTPKSPKNFGCPNIHTPDPFHSLEWPAIRGCVKVGHSKNVTDKGEHDHNRGKAVKKAPYV